MNVSCRFQVPRSIVVHELYAASTNESCINPVLCTNENNCASHIKYSTLLLLKVLLYSTTLLRIVVCIVARLFFRDPMVMMTSPMPNKILRSHLLLELDSIQG